MRLAERQISEPSSLYWKWRFHCWRRGLKSRTRRPVTGVSAMRSIAFEPIAKRTRQPQIFFIVTPATGAGFDVLNM